ncbi:Bromodomain-containing protein 8 [Eumeta japonica]|uniref:Bromodomain-containing protein 8 n=1 Tax=Eumeta variegata TaxID=151549 RepID=A0A4C1ZGK0_EUMVA|nr:Bromodomain-containing protein 8 [Eumeta japonica]
MASIQERLQLKRIPLDTWNIREQLCLASAVARSGDQNWMSVSRALKTVCDPNRPADWYSQKSLLIVVMFRISVSVSVFADIRGATLSNLPKQIEDLAYTPSALASGLGGIWMNFTDLFR